MKSLLFIMLVSISFTCFSQFKAKNGDIINVGDTLIIGKASGQFGFDFITQAGQRMHPSHAGKKIVITALKNLGKRGDEKTYLQFKGFGLPVYIDYDNAIESKEIVNPHGKITREQAIAKLKEAKDLLDLQIISQMKYDSIKNSLITIIK
jgi:hypothetical protein